MKDFAIPCLDLTKYQLVQLTLDGWALCPGIDNDWHVNDLGFIEFHCYVKSDSRSTVLVLTQDYDTGRLRSWRFNMAWIANQSLEPWQEVTVNARPT